MQICPASGCSKRKRITSGMKKARSFDLFVLIWSSVSQYDSLVFTTNAHTHWYVYRAEIKLDTPNLSPTIAPFAKKPKRTTRPHDELFVRKSRYDTSRICTMSLIQASIQVFGVTLNRTPKIHWNSLSFLLVTYKGIQIPPITL